MRDTTVRDTTLRIERIRLRLRGDTRDAATALAAGLGPALAGRLADPLATAGPGRASVARLRVTAERAAGSPAPEVPAVADAIARSVAAHLPPPRRAR
ncbi:MAG: hypothetical protein A2V85_03070 [Chloroflexi bacterium RBG_16_72_14]|nr:MAG: hypothetical protein A2V85_03070 [Chloroflexi bacterium RBG_16_72_14]